MTGDKKGSRDKFDTLTKASLKSLSFVGQGQMATIEEDIMSLKSTGTSRNHGTTLTRTQTLFDTSNNMEAFLSHLSPDLRRVV
jgi:hypothetical protein